MTEPEKPPMYYHRDGQIFFQGRAGTWPLHEGDVARYTKMYAGETMKQSLEFKQALTDRDEWRKIRTAD